MEPLFPYLRVLKGVDSSHPQGTSWLWPSLLSQSWGIYTRWLRVVLPPVFFRIKSMEQLLVPAATGRSRSVTSAFGSGWAAGPPWMAHHPTHRQH